MKGRYGGTPYVAWSPASAEKPRIAIVGEDDQDSEGGCCNGFCAYVLVIVSVILVIMFFPFSLFFLIKVPVIILMNEACNMLHVHVDCTRI